jgi:Putative bacterial sensory transduction regulator
MPRYVLATVLMAAAFPVMTAASTTKGLSLLGAKIDTATVPARAGVGEDSRVLTTITGPELAEILEQAGFEGGRVDEYGDVLVAMDERSVYFLIASNRESVQARTAWRTSDSTRPSADRMNEWNRSKKYSKAYFDRDRDPVLELDLDLAGGVTIARLKDFAHTTNTSVTTFVQQVLH